MNPSKRSEMVQEKKNNQDDNDSGYSEEEALIIFKKKRTKAQNCYRRANAAVIPDFIPPEERNDSDSVLRETRVYTPENGLSEQEMRRYLYRAKLYNFNKEQALGVLHINEYKIDKACVDLKNFAPLPSQWPNDKSVFINGLKEEEKFFYAIKDRFLPNRTVGNLVEYYYTWKMEKKKNQRRQIARMKMKLKKNCSQRNTLTSA